MTPVVNRSTSTKLPVRVRHAIRAAASDPDGCPSEAWRFRPSGPLRSRAAERRFVGTAGVEPAWTCSQSKWATATPNPGMRCTPALTGLRTGPADDAGPVRSGR